MLKVWQVLTAVSQDTARGNHVAQPETHTHTLVYTHACTYSCVHIFDALHIYSMCKSISSLALPPHTHVNGAIGKVRPI